MTLGDSFEEFMAKYIRKTPSESKKDTYNPLDDPMFQVDEFSDDLKKFEPMIDGKKMDSKMCRYVALTSPLFCKGVWKKTMDTFRAGFQVVDTEGNELKNPEKIWIDSFNKRNDINVLMFKMKLCNHIYGFAPVYIRFAEELKQGRNIDHSRAPPEKAEPFKLMVLNPEKIERFDYKSTYWKRKGVKHLKYKPSMNETYWIHPDRIEMVPEKQLPFSMFGISDVVLLRHILSSNADIDISTGKILKWFSYGVREWKKRNASPDEKDAMLKHLKQHPDVIASDMDDYEFKIHTPEAIDPEPFYNHIVMSIAGVLVMPTHILTGVRVGRVTGAEAGYSDYYRDINDAQSLTYTPFLERMYQRIYSAHDTPRKEYIFAAMIEWNPTYVNEMAEAELLEKRSQAVERLMGKQHEPVISVEEARKILERGAIKFDDVLKISRSQKQPQENVKASLNTFKNIIMNDSELKELKEQIERETNGRS